MVLATSAGFIEKHVIRVGAGNNRVPEVWKTTPALKIQVVLTKYFKPSGVFPRLSREFARSSSREIGRGVCTEMFFPSPPYLGKGQRRMRCSPYAYPFTESRLPCYRV